MTYERLNRAFRMLLDGAELVTLARNRYWQAKDGLMLDVGAVLRGARARLREDRDSRGQALARVLRRPRWPRRAPRPSETAVVGDDLESDVGGRPARRDARRPRADREVPRRTTSRQSPVRPDAVLASIAELPRFS